MRVAGAFCFLFACGGIAKDCGDLRSHGPGLVHQVRDWYSGVAIKRGRRPGAIFQESFTGKLVLGSFKLLSGPEGVTLCPYLTKSVAHKRLWSRYFHGP